MDKTSLAAPDKLEQALHDFACSPRFVLFKDIQLGRLMPEECEGESPLYAMTLEALVTRATSLSRDSQLCTETQAEILLQLLVALSEEPTTCASNRYSTAGIVRSQGEQEVSEDAYTSVAQVPGSVQLEQDLLNLRAQIAAHPNYQGFAAKTLGEYWDPAWAPAPFEEALTIKQFLSIDVATLFKKKSVTGERTANVCETLRRILDALEGRPANQVKTEPSRIFKSSKIARKYNRAAAPLLTWSVAELAVHEVLTRGSHEPCPQELADLVNAFISHFKPEECIDVVLGRELPPKLMQKLARVVEKAMAPVTLNLVRRLLEGPAVRIDYVANIISASCDCPDAFMTCVAMIVARGVGAMQVRYNGMTCLGFWTLNPASLQRLLNDTLRPSGRRGANGKQAGSPLSLDPFLLRFIQGQGKPLLSRKGRPKRLKSRP